MTQIVIGPGPPGAPGPVGEALRQPVTETERAEIETAVAGLSGRALSQEALSEEALSEEAGP